MIDFKLIYSTYMENITFSLVRTKFTYSLCEHNSIRFASLLSHSVETIKFHSGNIIVDKSSSFEFISAKSDSLLLQINHQPHIHQSHMITRHHTNIRTRQP